MHGCINSITHTPTPIHLISGIDDLSVLAQDSPGQFFSLEPRTLVAVVEAIVKYLAPSSRLSYLRELEEAYEKKAGCSVLANWPFY